VNNFYECVKGPAGATCSKYIFAGNQRIALKDHISTLFFHGDHFGSSSVITDSKKNLDGTIRVAQILHYLPYGNRRPGSPSGGVRY
jgi:hypothetical protein